MKRNILLFCALCFIVCSCKTPISKEKDIQDIKNTVKQYSDYLVKEDYGSLINFIYPAVISRFSKQEIINDLKSSTHNDDYDIVVKQIDIDSISDIVVRGENRYAVVKNQTTGSFTIKGGALKNPLTRDSVYNYFCADFGKTYGRSNVTCNDSEKIVTVIMKGEVYPIFLGKYKKWFILSDTNPADVVRFIPYEIRNKLGITTSDKN